MNFPTQIKLRQTAVAAALAVVCGGAFAQSSPDFTVSPGDISLGGYNATTNRGTFSGDEIKLADVSSVTITGSSFVESGFLAVSSVALNNTQIVAPGLNSTYGLYFRFNGAGTLSDATLPNTDGTFTSLTYELYGYTGAPATFSFTGTTPTKTATTDTLLASGTLAAGGNFVSTRAGGASFFTSAGAPVSFNVAPGAAAFFDSPNPFYDMAYATFAHTPNQVTAFGNGFSVQGSGGTFNFVAAPIPEPETYALMLAGLGVVGFMARRRRS